MKRSGRNSGLRDEEVLDLNSIGIRRIYGTYGGGACCYKVSRKIERQLLREREAMGTLGYSCVAISVLLIFCGFAPSSHGEFVPEDFEEKLDKLYEVIDYIHERPDQMNADATLSVTIVEANLAATINHENARLLGYEDRLKAIMAFSDSTRRLLLDKIIPQDEDIRLQHESWNEPDLWIRRIRWRRGVLEKGRVDGRLTYRDIRDLVMQGTPNEWESNRCLTEIVRNRRESVCRMPDVCVEILTSPKSSRGYPLTHRLFIVQVAEAMKCSQSLPYSELVVSYCSAILQDLTDIEAAGFPYQTSDLMMEQGINIREVEHACREEVRRKRISAAIAMPLASPLLRFLCLSVGA